MSRPPSAESSGASSRLVDAAMGLYARATASAGQLRERATATWAHVADVVPRNAPRHMVGLDSHHTGHVELPLFARYAMVGMLLVVCLLVNAWSRIDIRQTSLAVYDAEVELQRARAENARLRLELASLQDPAALSVAAEQLELASDVAIVDVPRHH
ncbi:MAG: hypothetical protein H6742_15615 [Alphaproteobacteria bacterium]|nr:hypothetical protein [Alphaproteobacteria bacterium]